MMHPLTLVHPSRVLPYACILTLWAMLAGCDAWSSRPDPLATEIKEVCIQPDPVPAGGIATFTVIHPDTAKQGFQYVWLLPEGGAETEVPRYGWTAPAVPGEYYFQVKVRREGNYVSVQRTFTVTVTAAP